MKDVGLFRVELLCIFPCTKKVDAAPATIKNEKLVTNIRPSTNPTTMTTNAGICVMNQDATIPRLGDPNLTANVLKFQFLQSKLKIEYDQKNNLFVVHTN